MDKESVKRMKRVLGYEKHMSTQLYEDLLKTTSEYKFYELGVAQGIYSIYTMLQNVLNNKHEEAKIKDIMEGIKLCADSYGDIGINFNKMIEYDKEDSDETK